MSTPYIGEIRIFAGNYAPENWAFCDGTVLRVADNQALFTLIGTTYGGDGVNTFALPDLRGRLPIHMGQGTNLTARLIGQKAGDEGVSLTTAQMPAHTHPFVAAGTAASASTPNGNMLANTSGVSVNGVSVCCYQQAANVTNSTSPDPLTISPAFSGPAGAGYPHNNVMPFVTVNYIIATLGIFPQHST